MRRSSGCSQAGLGLTLMPMLPSGLTSGRSLCVEPATPMSAPGWRSATRARGGVRRRDSPAPNLCIDLRYFAVQGKSSLLVVRAPGGWEHHEPHEEAHPVADSGGDPDVR